MTAGITNTFYLSGQVMEIILEDHKQVVKTICKLGSLIIEIPYDENFKLGD